MRRYAVFPILLIVGGLYWQFTCQMAGVGEPWDADAFWRLWYPMVLLLSALAGMGRTQPHATATGIDRAISKHHLMPVENGGPDVVSPGQLLLTGWSISSPRWAADHDRSGRVPFSGRRLDDRQHLRMVCLP